MKLLDRITGLLFGEFGIMSFTGLLDSLIGWKYQITTLYVFSITIGGIITVVKDFSVNYVYRPFLGLELLWICSILDVFLGITVALESKTPIDHKRMLRAVVRALLQSSFVAILFNMSKVYDLLIYKWMVDSMLLLFTSSVFWSCVVNAWKLGYITDEQYKLLQNIINIKTLLNKLTNGINKSKP